MAEEGAKCGVYTLTTGIKKGDGRWWARVEDEYSYAIGYGDDQWSAAQDAISEAQFIFDGAGLRIVKDPCRFPLDDGRRCAECETCQP